MKQSSYTPPCYIYSVIAAAFLLFSCNNLLRQGESAKIAIRIPIEQISGARAAEWMQEDKSVYRCEVGLFARGKEEKEPQIQEQEGSLLELSQKTFVFENLSVGDEIAVWTYVTNGELAWRGESETVTLAAGVNDLRIKMRAEAVENKCRHEWNAGEVTKAPTENEDGVRTFTCKICGSTKTEAEPALNHSHTIAAEWTSNAFYHWHAASCGNPDHDVSKDEHVWDSGKTTTPATENEDGIKTYTCTVCGETKIESIPKIEIVSLKIGSEFNSAITNKADIEKVVFGLLSDSDIKNIVSNATIAAAKVDVGAIPSTYYAYTVDTTLYIVPADEDAEKIVLNPDSNSLFRGFSECASIEGLSLLDTSNVTDMTSMFFECSVLTGLDLSGFDTSHVTNMSYMFYRCLCLTSLDLSNFNTSKVTNMWEMFNGCSGLTSLDVSKFNTSNVTNMYSMFDSCSGLTSLDVSKFDTSSVTKMGSMFSGCSKLESLDVSSFNTSKVTGDGMASMFSSCSGLKSLDLSNFDTSKVTNMGGMFSGCSKLTSLNVSNFDTSSVTNMWYMFRSCSGLESLDLSNFDTSKVTKMGSMFAFCSGLTSLDLSKFDTSNVADMSSMFDGCSGLTSLDLSKFDTSSVTSMSSMFSSCSGLTSLNVSNFDTQSVTNMRFMFSSCSGLTSLDLSNFNTSNVTNMSSMFKSCSGLTGLDLSSFDTSSVTSMESMFSGCSKLTTIYVADKNNVPQNLQNATPTSASFVTKH